MQITTFSDDQAVILERPPAETIVNGPSTRQFADAISHSVISYLERPQLLMKDTWKSEDKRGARLFEKVSSTLTRKVLVPDLNLTEMIRNKLDGFSSFRATAVFRIQVNAQPFQQGRLIMAAIPMPTLIRPRDEYIASHVSLLQAVNHVQLDINKQSEVTLRIPFVSPYTAYDLIHGQYPWARVVVSVYSELSQVEKPSLEVLLWGSFENIELGAPTSARVVQQSGVVPVSPSSQQVGQIRQSEAPGTGSLLSGLTTSAMNAMPGGGLVSSLASGLGGLLGFSKPNSPDTGCSIVQRPAQYFGNVDGIDQSHVLALDRLNAIDEYPGLGGTDLDECSLEYLTKIPQYIAQFGFASNSKYDDILWKTNVSPSYYIPGDISIKAARNNSKYKYNSSPTPQPTILNYVSSPFLYWSGSLVYTLRFVKTDFHSGRLEVAFHPYTNTVPIARYDYVYRLVIDLRETSEVSFVVPYISPTPWKNISPIDPLTTTLPWNDFGPFSTGCLTVRALTPLLSSNAVANKCIECLVEVRAGTDFKLAGPCKAVYYPISLTVPESTNRVVQQGGEVFSIAGTQETRTSALTGFMPPCITNNPSDMLREDTQKLCAGELFSNFRALTRRFSFVDSNQALAGSIWTIRPAYYLRPPLVEILPVKGPQDEKSLQCRFTYQASPMCFVSSMYAFYRGGIRVKVYSATGRTSAGTNTFRDPSMVAARLNTVQSQGNPQPGTSTFLKNVIPYMSPVGFEQPSQKQLAEYQIPYYSPTLVAVHWDYRQISAFSQSQVSLELSTTHDIDDFYPALHLAMAGADDLNFHSFIGVPFVVTSDIFTDNFGTATNPAVNWSTSSSIDPTYRTVQIGTLGTPDGTITGSRYLTFAPLDGAGDISVTLPAAACPIPDPPGPGESGNKAPPGGFPKYPWEKPPVPNNTPIILERLD